MSSHDNTSLQKNVSFTLILTINEDEIEATVLLNSIQAKVKAI